jgi:hypothetical protein
MSKPRIFSIPGDLRGVPKRGDVRCISFSNVRAEMEIDVEELTKRHGSKLSSLEWAPFPETLGVKPVVYAPCAIYVP